MIIGITLFFNWNKDEKNWQINKIKNDKLKDHNKLKNLIILQR